MAGTLEKSGLYFDELNKIRVLEPQVAHKTTELREECKIFVEKNEEFKKITDDFLSVVTKLVEQVEKEKLQAVGRHNIGQSMDERRHVQSQQLQALILEKTMELERLKIYYNSLQKTEIRQQDIIDKLRHY